METGVHVSIQIRSVCNGNWSACIHPNKECAMETGVHVSIQIRSVCNGNWSACFNPNKECLQWKLECMFPSK